jgi:hypothetical protein
MRSVLLFALVSLFAISAPAAHQPLDVSMLKLLATPERFDGKFIRTYGFLRIAFEGKALYFHKDDYSHQLYKNSVWVDLPETGEYLNLNMHYVLIEGIFNANSYGHLHMFSGTLEKISRVQPLQ